MDVPLMGNPGDHSGSVKNNAGSDPLFRFTRGLLYLTKVCGDTNSTHKVLALLYISSHEGCIVSEVTTALNVAPTTGSRLVAELGHRGRSRALDREASPGLQDIPPAGLVESYLDPYDAKLRRLRLTPKGHAVIARARRIMAGQANGF
jgi:DNA-binding MarR family transcriptional regulator